MTTTLSPPSSPPAPTPPSHRRRRVATVAAAVVVVALAATGLGVGLAATGGSSPGPGTESSYAYYQSMMGRFGIGQMMGGSNYGWMTGQSGYAWMMGGTSGPAWMRGGSLPGFMMGSGTDPGKVMGQLFANEPGPRVDAAQASTVGNQVPTGATVNRGAHRITFSGQDVTMTMLASPAGGPDETFEVAGMVNPTIVVARGAAVTIELVNADNDTAHGVVVSALGATSSWMPMMTAEPAFSGSALWFLGNPTSAGMHAGTLTFTASTAGTYQYLCPVPGHAQKGMVGTFTVSD